MKWILIVLMALTLMSCKGAFVETGQGEARYAQETKNCYYSGLCRKCKTRSGKRKCSTSYHSNCDGHKTVQIRITPIKGYYQKEPNVKVTVQRKNVVKDLSKCR